MKNEIKIYKVRLHNGDYVTTYNESLFNYKKEEGTEMTVLGIEVVTMSKIEDIVSVLTEEQKQLLKDTIRYGSWGDADYDFLDENGNTETVSMLGYCTNDAKLAGNFSGRKVSAMFRSIYKKLCPNGIGRYISHHSDRWGDGTGDMMFIRYGYYELFEIWARN